MAKKCPECDAVVSGKSHFCSQCGSSLKPEGEAGITKTVKKSVPGIGPGKKIAKKYKIVKKIGEGGMGVVYQAEDTRLDRTVALKFLPSELTRNAQARARFIQEAKAAAALDHPHICTVYEVDEAEGQTFISMAYIQGQSLKDKIEDQALKIDEAAELSKQIAEGLKEAHDQGIIHRDIKPANILLTQKGQAKISDFGLAKLSGGVDLTKTHSVMGTVAYMSPEQARGEEVDLRSDIWSFGCVLYELIGRQRPFQADNEQAVIYAILNEEPEPIATLIKDVPIGFEMILHKCLQKDPRNRYKDADALIKDLASIELGKEIDDSPSIAVLPFVNMSADPDNEYFSDGLSESIINNLTQIKDFKVVARTSAFSFKGKEEDVRKIGKTLNVNKVLEGSVQKAGNRLRITAQLINVADGYHLWSERFDRNMADLFAIQDEISLAIVDNLKLNLLKKDKNRLIKRHTTDPEAYNLYLKGRYFYNKRLAKDLNKSIDYYEQALKKDPEFAQPYSGLADTFIGLGFYELMPFREAYTKAEKAALKAIELDDQVGEPHVSMGMLEAYYKWDMKAAEKEFKKAIALNPANVDAHHMYAHFLEGNGRFDEAISEMQQGLELEPVSVNLNNCLGEVLYWSRRYDDAIAQLRKTIEIDPNFHLTYYYMGRSYLQQQKYEEALQWLEKAETFKEIHSLTLGTLGYVYAISGEKSKAERIRDRMLRRSRMKYVNPYYMALVYMGLGDLDQVFDLLGKAYEDFSVFMTYLRIEPFFDSLRSDKRYYHLLERMGLEDVEVFQNFHIS